MGENKILVIDDDLDTLRLLELIMKREGFQVVSASTDQHAEYMIRQEKPDLILLDVVLPQHGGIELARRLRDDPETKEILIILFSARGSPDEMMRGFKAGADDYLIKPIQPRELIARVKAVLKQSSSHLIKPAIQASRPMESLPSGQRIGVISSKGGVGVSFLTTNLGIALFQESAQHVIVADFRPGNSTISAETGYTSRNGLEKLLSLEPDHITVQRVENQLHHHESGVDFLLASSHPQDAHYNNAGPQFSRISQLLSSLGRHIVLDLGPSLIQGVEQVLSSCQQVIVVMEPTPHNVISTRLLLEDIRQTTSEARSVFVVLINRSKHSPALTLDQVEDSICQKIKISISPVEDLVFRSQIERKPILMCDPKSPVADQFRILADRLIQASY